MPLALHHVGSIHTGGEDSNQNLARARIRRRALSAAKNFRTAGCGYLDEDRKSTRLNSSHQIISYAVFCLKKKKKKTQNNEEFLNEMYTSSIEITKIL